MDTPQQPEPSAADRQLAEQISDYLTVGMNHTTAGAKSSMAHMIAAHVAASLQAERSANAELLRDKARLDWLETRLFLSHRSKHPENGLTWIVADGVTQQASTLRLAIDAARTAPLPAPAGEKEI